MSHGKERKEKNCLNCNARVFGPYCHVCGQENLEPKETAWGLVLHFFNDITHFEGKFISSLRYILFRPGLLTAEYMRGRRASYMNPVRMYVFTSAFFFILFFSFFSGTDKEHEMIKFSEPKKQGGLHISTTGTEVDAKQEALSEAEDKEDSDFIEKMVPAKEKYKWNPKDSLQQQKTKVKTDTITYDKKYKTIQEYEIAQQKLPAAERDNFMERAIKRRLILVQEKYGGDYSSYNKALFEHAIHSLPKMLFISLPLFALILSLLYIRRKQFYYVSHLIFTIHLFVFTFLCLLLIFSINKLEEYTGSSYLGWISGGFWIYLFIYLYKAMRRMYQQGRAKTMLKYFILLFLAFIVNAILFLGLFSYTFFNI